MKTDARIFCWGGGQVAAASHMDLQCAKTLDCMHEAPRILTIRLSQKDITMGKKNETDRNGHL